MTAPTLPRPTLLLAVKIPANLLEQLTARYEVLGPLGQPFGRSVAALPRADAARVQALITMGTVDTSRAAIDTLPALRMISCFGSGYEGVDLAAARERGIAVTHSPGANAAAVADLALGLLIASVRGMFGASAYLHDGAWENKGRLRRGRRGLARRRIGIYGLGAIGEKIARRAIACEMEVAYHNRKPRADVPYPYYASLLELATWADVLMVAVRADASNRHAVDAGVLKALGSDGHVVNIARGSAIDEQALIAALRNGDIAGAGLDVFEHEPAVPQALRAIPNIALTPHIAGDTDEARAAMSRMVLANLDALFAGRPVPNPVV
jgi:hydroxypyruvate reductase